MHGRQQQTAMPMTHASAMQNTTKNTSNAKNTTQSLHFDNGTFTVSKSKGM
jgi:hypothetical protein